MSPGRPSVVIRQNAGYLSASRVRIALLRGIARQKGEKGEM